MSQLTMLSCSVVVSPSLRLLLFFASLSLLSFHQARVTPPCSIGALNGTSECSGFLCWRCSFFFLFNNLVSFLALIDLYFATNGPFWNISTNWMDGDPCLQEWEGVGCDSFNSSVVFLCVTFRFFPFGILIFETESWRVTFSMEQFRCQSEIWRV